VSLAGRLFLKTLWLKKTYSFYWAHKPLCAAYKEDVIKIKNIHLCRSCCCVYLGVILSFFFLVFRGSFHTGYSSTFLLASSSVTLLLSYPTLYKRLPRMLRDGCRFSVGVILVGTLYALFNGRIMLALAVILPSAIAWKIYYQQRGKRKLHVCYACNEYSQSEVCSGFRLQTKRIGEYQAEATEYLLKTGYVPDILKQ